MGTIYAAPQRDRDMEMTSPALFLKEKMDSMAWSQGDLAYVIGVSPATINPILRGKRAISAGMARALGNAFGCDPADFAKVQADWDVRQAKTPDPSVQTRARIQTKYPLREMIKRGWMSDSKDISEQVRKFFGTSSIDETPHINHSGKKTTYDEVPPVQLAWLFRVMAISREMIVPRYSKARLLDALAEMKRLLLSPENVRHVPKLLHEAGVRFVIVEALPAGKIDGVCFWLDDDSPVIGLSMRFDRIDNFWFVLRHECEHVLCEHGKSTPVIDIDVGEVSTEEDERIANAAAANFLVPAERLNSFYLRKKPFFAEQDVIAFSKILGVHPGIVIGALQRLIGRYDLLRKHLLPVRSHLVGSALIDGWGDIVPIG